MSHANKPSVKELFLYLEGELSPSRAKEIEHHLQNCSYCQNQLSQQQKLIQSLAEFDEDLNQVDLVPAIREAIDTEEKRIKQKKEGLNLILIVVTVGLLLSGALLYFFLH